MLPKSWEQQANKNLDRAITIRIRAASGQTAFHNGFATFNIKPENDNHASSSARIFCPVFSSIVQQLPCRVQLDLTRHEHEHDVSNVTSFAIVEPSK